MSLVVAYKHGGTVYMGADTQSTYDTAISRVLNESGYKITRLQSGILIGICGSVKARQKIVAQKEWFNLPEGETLSKRHIVQNIIPKLCVLSKSLSDDKSARNSSLDESILMAHKDKMFMIAHYYEVYECGRYAAIGSGKDYSKYCLSQIERSGDVNEGLLGALRAGAKFDSSVSAPYVLIDTLHREYKIVEG